MNHLRPKTYANKLSWCLGVVMTLLLAGCNTGDKEPILSPDRLTGLTQIVVNPTNPSIPSGLSRQFEALGVYADGTSVNISDRVTWNSATTLVATVNATGMVSAKTNGTSVISAAVAGKTGQTSLTVTDAALVSISLTPLAGTAIAGVKTQFAATGVYSNGSSQNLTSAVLWTSSAATVVSFNQDQLPDSGLATALAAGTTTVTATLANISANTTFTVAAASVTGLVITPANPSIIVGLTQQMAVTATFNNGNTIDVTSQAIWTSADISRLTFNTNGAANSGLAAAVAAGPVGISASFGGMTATGNVLVNSAALTALSVTPATATIAAGNSQQFMATGVYNNGTSADITTMVTWASSDTTVAYMNANLAANSGLATSLVPGSAMISATMTTATGDISNSATLTVNNAVITSVTMTPMTPQLINGFAQQFMAFANYTDQTTVDVTAMAIWTSSDTAVITMNPSGMADSGLATPLLAGTSLITATFDAMNAASTTATVVDASLTSIAITPLLPSLAAGSSQQMTATGTFSNGNTMNLNRFVTWLSADPTVATFNPNLQNNSGLLNSIVTGSTDFSATIDGFQVTSTVTVTNAVLTGMMLVPQSPTMYVGQTLQLQLIGTYTDSTTTDLTTTAIWSSSNTSVATLNPNLQLDSGLVSALTTGNATLRADFTTPEQQTFFSETVVTVNPALAANPQAPALGTVGSLVIAASSGINTTAGTTISNGDLALLDVGRIAYTGFTPGANLGQFIELSNGTTYAPDDANPPYLVPAPYATSAAYLNQVKTDLMAVSTFLAAPTNPTATITMLTDNELGGDTLTRGVYHLTGDVLISEGTFVLDAQGDSNSVFIFHVDGNFNTTVVGGNIALVNGAKASNVYWHSTGTATIGSDSLFAGNVVALLPVQVQTGATVQGRLFSVTSTIVLNDSSITKPL